MAVIVTQQGSDLSIQQNLVGDGTSLVVSYGTPTATQCRIGLAPSSNLAELAAMTGGGIVVRSNSTSSMNLCTFYSSDSSISINFNSIQANFQLGSTLTGTYAFSNPIRLPVNSLALSALSTAGSTSGYVLTSNGSGVAPTWQAGGGGGGGGLTSVGLGEASGGTNFDFTNNPLTSNGTITLDIAVGGLPLTRLAQSGATTGQILAWSGSAWAPASGGGGSGLTSVGLTSTGGTATITGSPLTANGAMNIEIPNWSTIPASGNVNLGTYYIDFDNIALQENTENISLNIVTGSNGTGAVYDSQFNPIGGFGGTAGQILSLITPAAFGSPGTPQVLGWIDKGASTISVIAPGLSATAVGGITFAGSGVSGTAAGGIATITIPGGGGGGAVTSVSATGGTSVINPTTGAVILQMDLPIFNDTTKANFFLGSDAPNVGNGNLNITGGVCFNYGEAQATQNTAVGIYALAELIGGSNNSGFGYNALNNVNNGTNNTAVGSLALSNVTTGSHNTALGYSAGPNSGIITSRCTFLGSSSETATTGIFNAIAIGYNSVVNESNAAVLGDPTQDMTLGIGTDTPCPAGQLHLSQKNSASPSAIIMDAIPLATTAGSSVPDGALCIANMQTNNTSVPFPVVAKGPSGTFAGVPLFEMSSLVEGSYPAGSVLYTATSDGITDNLLFFTSCPQGSKASFGIDFTGANPTPVWTPIAASSLAQSFVALGTSESPTPVAQNISYIATESVVTEPTEFTLPLDLPLGSSFRVIGNNPYGWIITSQLGQGTNQRICWGSIFALATSSQIAYIQTVGTQFPYLNASIELVYTFTENDGTQVWTVVNSQETLDIGTI